MSDFAIKVKNLSKIYRIGSTYKPDTLSEKYKIYSLARLENIMN